MYDNEKKNFKKMTHAIRARQAFFFLSQLSLYFTNYIYGDPLRGGTRNITHDDDCSAIVADARAF